MKLSHFVFIITVVSYFQFQVSWDVEQFVPKACQEPNSWKVDSTHCLSKIKHHETKTFENEKQAREFISTQPSEFYQAFYRAKITNVKLEKVSKPWQK